MMKILLLLLIISANCVKMNYDEESSTTENFKEVSEKTELFTADQELQSKTEYEQNEDNASKTIEDSEETRVLRSSSELSTNHETQSDDSLKSRSTEKSTSDEIISETKGRQDDKKLNQPTRRANSGGPAEEDKKSSGVLEKQLEESHETSSSASETEDRKAEDLPEASAESKLSDNEKASFNIDVTNRNSDTEEVTEISDELRLNGNRETRRMFSGPDNIIIDTKMRADTKPEAVEQEVKTALSQNLNTYNNLNEFGTDSNYKLIDPPRTAASPVTEKRNMPIVTKLATQEILNQRYLPKFYPHSDLNINFPNINSDFQGPRDLPVYLKIKQDEHQSQNHYTGAQISPFKFAQENNFVNPSNQYHQPQNSAHTEEIFPNKQFENIRVESGLEQSKLFTHPVSKNFLGLRNQNNQIRIKPNQEKIKPNYKNLGDLNRETYNEGVKEKSEMALKNSNDPGNQYPLFHQPERMSNSIIIDQKFVTETNPYSSLQHRNHQGINVLNAQRKNVDLIPPNIKALFQKLASASLYPWKLSTNVYSKDNIQNHPFFTSPLYVPGCC